MDWTTFRLTTTTPVLNGDDLHAAFRVSSLRGAMRFWFRALAGHRVGANLTTLRALEDRVFGTTGCPSPVRMRVVPENKSNDNGNYTWDTGTAERARWIAYLWGQQSNTAGKRGVSLHNVSLRPGETTTLKVKLSGDDTIDTLVIASLWLVCAYGGVGGRVRRGFGGLRAAHKSGPLPGIWRDRAAETFGPNLDHYVKVAETGSLSPHGVIAESLDSLDALIDRFHGATGSAPDESTAPPRYPTLSSKHTRAGISAHTADDLTGIAAYTGEQFRRARAPVDNRSSHSDYQPKIKTAEYRDVVQEGKNNDFPLAAFGLPVQFKKTMTATAYKGSAPLRRASPLWLRFVCDRENDQWKVFSFAFHNEYLAGEDDIAIMLDRGGRKQPLNVTHHHVVERTTEWIDRMSSEESPYS
ncbi:CRISPR-associated protein Cmr1 [Haloactinospora alba]|uniref:CRISPR-associated protein Cmr1 n=1 Tax=Haloactinospora alba TaxID=405555 RepID=A0A543N9W4_9ACTN|nr:type III-B CRISPR module RAMP protein Cmr1 [Haloactinospora alba]TQN28621.1 CRISPR-associated protein Cmr1 [Haloactinospora alba]